MIDDFILKWCRKWEGLFFPPSVSFRSFDEWQKFEEERELQPYRNFLSKIPSYIFDYIYYIPSKWYHNIEDWIKYRVAKNSRHHVVYTELSPGCYDLDERLLFGAFALLKDYVEIDIPDMYAGDNRKYDWYGRNPEAGVNLLETNCAGHSLIIEKELLELYKWWIDRADRIDPFLAASIGDGFEPKAWQLHEDIDNGYDKEDNEMLLRLMTIRNELWM